MGLITKARSRETNRIGWSLVGTIDSATAGEASALGTGSRFYDTRLSDDNAVAFEANPGLNVLEIRFAMDTNNHDVDIELYAVREGDDDMVRMCTLDVVCGNQDSTNRGKWADTINLTNENWITDMVVVEPGADHIARLVFDTCGYYKFLFWGYGTFDSDCSIEVSGY